MPRPRIVRRFFLGAFAVLAAALALSGAFAHFQLRHLAREQAREGLAAQARLLAAVAAPLLAEKRGEGRLAAEVERLGRGSGVRLTVVAPGGEVLADSAVGAAGIGAMENHGDRPEVAAALSGADGSSIRRSVTEGVEEIYAAVPVRAGGAVAGAARASVRLSTLAGTAARLRVAWAVSALAALLATLALSALLGRRLASALSDLSRAAGEFSEGQLDRRVDVRGAGELTDVAEAMNRMAERLRGTLAEREGERARLALLLDTLSEGALVVGDGKEIRVASREARRLLGVGGRHVEGRPYPEVVRHPGLLAFLDEARRDGTAGPREVSLPVGEGTRDVLLSAARVDLGGDRGELVATLRDVTEEKRLARVKSDFASNASHELRTPLTTVRGYLEALLDAHREGEAPDPAFLEVAHRNALRMERIIDDLLELARAEAPGATREREPLVPRALLADVAALYAAEASARGKRVVAEGGEEPFPGDRRKLVLALGNLLENALRYGKEGGTVRLEGGVEGGEAVLRVSDDGPGIEPEHLPRLFERFYRVDRGRSRDEGGTGLGLSIVRHLVESHGGTVSVASRPGEGTTFTIRLPAG